MFNLKRYGQIETAPEDALDIIEDENTKLEHNINTGDSLNKQPITTQEYNLDAAQTRALDNMSAQNAWQQMMAEAAKYKRNGVDAEGLLNSNPEFLRLQKQIGTFDIRSFGLDDASITKLTQLAGQDSRHTNTIVNFKRSLQDAFEKLKEQKARRNLGVPNTSRIAPIPGLAVAAQVQQQQTADGFPVQNAADLANKFYSKLVTNDQALFTQTANYILQQVVGDIQEQEIKDFLQKFWELEPETDQTAAMDLFGMLFEMLPGSLKTKRTMEPIMSNKNPKGIIKYDLSDHVLNNKIASNGLIKTAADHFGQEYVLYGPTEKRICPKLSGKGGGQPNSSNVVSEYICRHHCLDGIVIDDNKTICGEALWRANGMDKFSREYVDIDGNITGGYINKRFEINRNVPEENKMRLKPGELRKPRPAEWGSTESRMQAMRDKEGEKRGYGPKTNTGEPFVWPQDADQNNLEVSQSEKDRRETSMGHELVNYTKKDKQENNPKVAQYDPNGYRNQKEKPSGHSDPQNQIGQWEGGWLNGEWKCPKCKTMLGKNLKNESPFALVQQHVCNNQSGLNPNNPIHPIAFNLKKYKTAQGIKGSYPWNEKERQYSQYSDEQLEFAAKDADQAAQSVGRDNPDQGWYADDVHTIMEEIKKRVQSRKWTGSDPNQLMNNLSIYSTDLTYSLNDQSDGMLDQSKPLVGNPGGQLKWKSDLSNWSANNLSPEGIYIGPDLSEFGFTYSPNTEIPLPKRYDAMLTWNMAVKRRASIAESQNYASTDGSVKQAQFGSIPLPTDGARSDRFLADPKKREDEENETKKKIYNKKDPSKKAFNLKQMKLAQMTGPRGPVGQDNPMSDDLGLSQDMHEDFETDDPFGPHNENSELIDDICSNIENMTTEEDVLNMLKQQYIGNQQSRLTSNDWDEIIDFSNRLIENQMRSTNHIKLNNGQFELAPNGMYQPEPPNNPASPMPSQDNPKPFNMQSHLAASKKETKLASTKNPFPKSSMVLGAQQAALKKKISHII